MLLGIACLSLFVPGRALALSAVEVLPADATVFAVTSHEIRFTTAKNLNSGSAIHLVYPPSFDLSGVVLDSSTGFASASLAVSVTGQTVVIDLSGAVVLVGPKTLTLSSVGNAPTAASYVDTLSTFKSNGTELEAAIPSSPFVLDAAPAEHLIVRAGAASFVAGEALSLRVDLFDTYGNPAVSGSDRQLDLLSDSPTGSYHQSVGAGAVSSVIVPADSTGIDLYYRDTLVSQSPITLTVLDASSLAPTLGFDQSTVSLVPAAVDASHSSVSAVSPVVADGSAVSTVTMVLRDAFDNPVAPVDSAAIDLSLDAPSYTVDKSDSASDVAGSFAAELSTLWAGSWTLRVTVSGTVLSQEPVVVFQARPVDALASTINVGPMAVADGADTVNLDLLFVDGAGRPVSGVDSSQVMIEVLDGGAAIDKLAALSADDGTFSVHLRSTVAGARRVTATVGAVALADTVQTGFVAGAVDAARSQAVVDGPVAANGIDSLTLDLTLLDAHGNAVSGVDSAAIDIAVSDALVEKTAGVSTDAGRFSALLRSTVAGSRPINVTAAGVPLDASPTALFVASGADSSASVLAVDGPAVADGSDAVTLTLTLLDAFSNPVSGVDSTRISLTHDPRWEAEKLDTQSDASGIFHLRLRSTTAGFGPAQALVDGSLVAGAVTVEFDPGPLDHFSMTLPDGAVVTAGASSRVDLLALDRYENRLTQTLATVRITAATAGDGTNVSWSSTGAGALAPAGPGVVDYSFAAADSGRVEFGMTDTLAESLALSAQSASATGAASLLVVSASAALMTMIDGDGQSAVVHTVVPLPLRARITDIYGNPVAGTAVDFSASGGGRIDTDPLTGGDQSTAFSDAQGLASCPVWELGPTAGAQQATAQAAFGAVLNYTATALAAAVAGLELVPSGLNDLTVSTSAAVVARATDAFGNPVDGVEVTIFVSDAIDGILSGIGQTDSLGLSQQRGLTGADGQLSVLYTSPSTAGASDVLDATAAGIPAGDVTDLTFRAVEGNASAISLLLPSSPTTAGAEGTFDLSLVDGYGNPVPGGSATIQLRTQPATGLMFSGFSGGPYTPSLDLPVVGSRTVYFTGGVQGSHAFTAGDAAGVLTGNNGQLEIIASNVVASYQLSTPAVVTAGQTFTMRADAYDAFGNAAVDAQEDFSLVLVDGVDSTRVQPVPLQVDAGSLSAGSFDTALQRIDTAGTYRIRLTSPSGQWYGAPIDVDPGAAWRLSAVGADSLSGVVAGDVVDLTVQTFDAFGNSVAGETLNVVSIEGGSLLVSPPATSATGQAVFRLSTSSVAGQAQLRVGILDGDPVSLETALFVITTQAGPIASLIVAPSLTEAMAGQAFSFTVRALDVSGNLVTSATDLVDFSSLGAGAVIVPSSANLSGGLVSAAVRDTLAGSIQLAAALHLDPSVTAQSPTITIRSAAPDRITAVGDTTVSAVQSSRVPLRAKVTDRYANPVEAVPVRLRILSSPDGASLEDPEPPVTDGLAVTDAQGELTFDLLMSPSSGTHRVQAAILDGDPADLETVEWTVEGLAGAADHLVLSLSADTLVAGQAVPLSFQLLDAADNLVALDGEVSLSAPGAAFNTQPSPIQLVQGTATVSLSIFTAGSFALDAVFGPMPSVTGGLAQVVVLAAAGSGSIGIASVDPPENTANGMAVTHIVTAAIHDAWNNVVAENSAVDVSADGGAIVSEDLDPARPGIQRRTDAAGQVEVVLASPLAAGAVNVDFASGGASGRATALFAAPAALELDGALSPTASAPGLNVDFALPVRNTGGVDALLSAGLCTLEFDDGGGTVVTTPLASDLVIPAGGSAVLHFAQVLIPPDFVPGDLRPSVQLGGQDEHGQVVTALLLLPQASLTVNALVVRSVTQQTQASVGDTIDVRVNVENMGGAQVTLTQLALSSSPAADFPLASQDPLPTLAPGAQADVVSQLVVGPLTAVGSYRFVARVSGSVDGGTFSAPEDSSVSPLVVSTASNLQIVEGSVTPAVIHLGAEFGLSVVVRNTGGALVSLDAARCTAKIGSSSYVAALSGPAAIAPQEETVLSFNSRVLDPSVGSGQFDLVLHLEGTEGISAFLADLVAPGAIVTQSPLALTLETPSLDPAAALRSSTVPFTLRLNNAGEASLQLDLQSTTLFLGEPGGRRLESLLDPNGALAILSGTNLLSFLPLALPADLVLGDPVGVVELRGTQNGLPYALDLPLSAGSLRLEDPSGLRILVTEALNPRAPSAEVNAGQRIPLRVIVGNAGGERVDSLRVRMEGVAVPASIAPEIFVPSLSGGETDTLLFDMDLTTAIGPETLRAEIIHAVSPITGQPVAVQSPLDDLASLIVQRPVSLAFTAQLSDGADSSYLKVSPGQVFALKVSLAGASTLDNQSTWLGVDVGLTGLGAFTAVDPSALPLHLDPDHPESVIEVRAPATSASADLTASLSRVDLDANDPAARPLTTPSSATVRVEVNGDVVFSACDLRVLSPAGALDGVLSTSQLFTVEGSLDGPDNLQQRSLELLLPEEFALVGGAARQDLPPGVTTARWDLRCGDLTASNLVLKAVGHATDVQSGEVLADTCSTALNMTVVESARATARLRVIAPRSAQLRGELPPDAVVEFEGGFDLSGDAASLGPARLRIEVPSGFALLDGTPEVLELNDPASVVTWRVRGPSRLDLGVQEIRLHTETPPTDENSELAASGSDVVAATSLTILADPLRLQVADLDSMGTLVGSDRFYPRTSLQLRNGLTGPVTLRRVRVEVVDEKGQPVSDPSSFLQALQLEREDAQQSFSAAVAGNPVTIEIGVSIASDSMATFVLGAQAKEGAPYASFAIALDHESVELTESGGFGLSYALLDGDGTGQQRVIVGRGVTSPSQEDLSAHSYPNPFVPSREEAVLAYFLKEESPVQIEIFDLLGERVRAWDFPLGSSQTHAGVHDGDVRWDGRNGRGNAVRNGVYVCRLHAGGRELVYRIAVTR